MMESNTCKKRNDKEEMMSNYDDKFDLHCANRDGDLFFIECPSCHHVDLKAKKILMCRDCGQHFVPYFEDGHKIIKNVKKFGKTLYDEVRLVTFDKKDDYFKVWHVPYPRHDIKGMNPNEIIYLRRDLRKDMKDGHGHEKYKKFLLIPVED